MLVSRGVFSFLFEVRERELMVFAGVNRDLLVDWGGLYD